MRTFSASGLGILAFTITRFVTAQLVVPLEQQPYDNQHPDENLDQIPIEVGFGWHNPGMEGIQPNGPPLLSDILGIDRSLSIFASLGRSVESVVRHL